MSSSKCKKLFWLAALLVIASATIYNSWPLGFWLNPAASKSGLASELGAIGQPYNWLFIAGDIVSGALLAAGCTLLYYLFRPTAWAQLCLILLAIYGICGALDAALPLQCSPSLQVCKSVLHDPSLLLHGVFDITGSVALFATLVAGWLHMKAYARQWLPWLYAVGVGGTLFALASGVLYVFHGPGYWAQRYYLTLSCIWVGSIPFILRSHIPNRHAKVSK